MVRVAVESQYRSMAVVARMSERGSIEDAVGDVVGTRSRTGSSMTYGKSLAVTDTDVITMSRDQGLLALQSVITAAQCLWRSLQDRDHRSPSRHPLWYYNGTWPLLCKGRDVIENQRMNNTETMNYSESPRNFCNKIKYSIIENSIYISRDINKSNCPSK